MGEQRQGVWYWILPVVVAAVLVSGAGPGLAQDATPPPELPLAMQLAVKERGWVRLSLQGTPGRAVRIHERLADGSELPVTHVTLASSATGRKRVVPWRCDRLDRTLVATAVAADGRVERVEETIATPRCTRRIAVDRVAGRAGRGLTVRLVDRWTVGDYAAELCAAPGGSRLRCQAVKFPAGKAVRVVRVAAPRPGRYRVQVRTAFGQRTSTSALVRRAGGRFRLLATGDSMIQIIDSFLARRLKPKGARVVSDAHISTGISKPEMLDWIAHAGSSARTVKPDVTVMFIGANDGFNLPRPGGAVAACCSGPWVDAYAARVKTMMRSYLRSGRGRVYWLLLPTPRGTTFRRVFSGVNAAVEQAARSFDGTEVRLLDLRRTFTPGGRFRPRYRQGDGVHLNTSGASIAANVILRALRRDGYVG